MDRDALRGFRRAPRAAALASTLVLVVLALAGCQGRGGPDHMEQGVALYQSGAYADAAHHFYRHAQAHPRDPAPHLYLGRVHRRLGRADLAAPALEEALRLGPDEPAVRREVGFLAIDDGRLDEAIDHFRAAVELDRGSPESWLGLVSALRLAGRSGEAEQVLASAPADVRARFGEPLDTAPPRP